MSDDGFDLPPGYEKYVDAETFLQILEMDDDDDDGREFSSALVMGFFEQAETTFKQMEDLLQEKDLQALSSLGHFLKGSSATLGIFKMRDSCEKIQHWGALKDEAGENDIDEDEALKKISDVMPTLKSEFEAARKWLNDFYHNEEEEDDE
ncbi:hypothetical protein TWF696_000610 [Orbilia brochopaga]|uniref:HPt domain-containing protein n=1 Tax=Orbilia brochopaga TaxID=3140254 RepID=A0AAV9VFC4_9PEZI